MALIDATVNNRHSGVLNRHSDSRSQLFRSPLRDRENKGEHGELYRQFVKGRWAVSVWRGLLNVVDDQHRNRTLARYKFHAKFLFEHGED